MTQDKDAELVFIIICYFQGLAVELSWGLAMVADVSMLLCSGEQELRTRQQCSWQHLWL